MFEPLDQAVVAQYAEAFKRGDAFPGVVVAKTNQRQRGILADGNHRLNGMIAAGGTDIDAYVIVKARHATIVQLTFEANAPSTHVHAAHSADGGRHEQAHDHDVVVGEQNDRQLHPQGTQ
jgi:hypothetical protein